MAAANGDKLFLCFACPFKSRDAFGMHEHYRHLHVITGRDLFGTLVHCVADMATPTAVDGHIDECNICQTMEQRMCFAGFLCVLAHSFLLYFGLCVVCVCLFGLCFWLCGVFWVQCFFLVP